MIVLFYNFFYTILRIPVFLISTLGYDRDRKYIKWWDVTDLLELVMSGCGVEWSDSSLAQLSSLALCPWKIHYWWICIICSCSNHHFYSLLWKIFLPHFNFLDNISNCPTLFVCSLSVSTIRYKFHESRNYTFDT